MKKWVAMVFAVVLCIGLTACGGDANKTAVSIDQLETALKENSAAGSSITDFTVTETGDGCSFSSSASGNSVFADVTYTGTADKDNSIQSVEFVYNNVKKTDALNDVEALKEIASKSTGDLTLNDMAVMQVYLDWAMLCEQFCGDTSSNYNFGAPVEGNGWKVTTSVSGEQVTIKVA